MCGIAGVWGNSPLERLKVMLPKMLHRGPDGEGIWSNGRLALGHRRLSINDLSSAGSQPMHSKDGSVIISVNGEIYNYSELREQLEALGCIFQSKSDSEVVLHAWSQWGEDAFSYFNGMFAIAIFDVNKDLLVLARDRLGIKPLYYSSPNSGELIFASEAKALKEEESFNLDFTGLCQFLTYQNYFSERTLANGISMLPSGSILYFQGKKERIVKYWTPLHTAKEIASFEDAVDIYKHVLDESIERHLMSDVSIASYLSAGFDSATVANRAAHLGEPPVSFTGSFNNQRGWYDENTMAKKLADDNGSQHIAVNIDHTDLPRVFDRLIYSMDEPRMGMGAFPQYCVAEQVAKTHKVVLTGHGGDELFSGYPVFKLMNLLYGEQNKLNRCIYGLSKIRSSELPHLLYFLLAQFKSNRHRQFLPVLNSLRSLRSGLRPEVFEIISQLSPEDELIEMGANNPNVEERLYNNYLNSYLNGLLVVEDKVSMAHSLESRTPLLDNAMVELSLSIPFSMKMHGNTLKSVIKSAGIGRLNSELYSQPKRGFPTPLRFWLRGPLKEWFSERIIGVQSPLRTLFKDEWLKQVHSNYLNSWRKNIRPLDEIQSHRVWQLLSLESWLRQNT